MSLFFKSFTGSARQIREVWYCDADSPTQWDVKIVGVTADSRVVAPETPDAAAYYVFCVWDRATIGESTQLITDGQVWGILQPDISQLILLDLESPAVAEYGFKDYSPEDQNLLLRYIRRYADMVLGND